MALHARPMVSERTEAPRLRILDTVAVSVIFGPTGGATKTLPKGTVVSYNTATNRWVEWANGGANGTDQVMGIVLDDDQSPLILQGADDTVGVVMLAGEAHRDDLVSDGGTSGQLDTALQEQARDRGIIVRGLEQIR